MSINLNVVTRFFENWGVPDCFTLQCCQIGFVFTCVLLDLENFPSKQCLHIFLGHFVVEHDCTDVVLEDGILAESGTLRHLNKNGDGPLKNSVTSNLFSHIGNTIAVL